MLLLSVLNFLLGNLRQANSHPLRQRSIVRTRSLFPQGPFVLVVSQEKALVLCHENYGSGIASILTHDIGCIYSLNTRMAFIAGCQQSEITGSPDFTRPSICDYLERVFLCTEAK